MPSTITATLVGVSTANARQRRRTMTGCPKCGCAESEGRYWPRLPFRYCPMRTCSECGYQYKVYADTGELIPEENDGAEQGVKP